MTGNNGRLIIYQYILLCLLYGAQQGWPSLLVASAVLFSTMYLSIDWSDSGRHFFLQYVDFVVEHYVVCGVDFVV